VQAGGTYLVGEKGPELFKAPVSGTIVPNSQLAGAMGGRQMVIHINPPPGMSRQGSSQFAADVARQLRQADLYNN
jgi:phage-related minor tail protein